MKRPGTDDLTVWSADSGYHDGGGKFNIIRSSTGEELAGEYGLPTYLTEQVVREHNHLLSLELVGYIVYETKFGGHWDFHPVRELPAGDFLKHRPEARPVYAERQP